MKLSIIAAIGRNNELGRNNDLIWHLKEDMKFFKQTTMGHNIVMGRKTFESLPKLLEGRHHIVLTRSDLTFPEEVDVYNSLESFIEDYQDKEVFNIGGAALYSELLDYADKLYLTEIDAEEKNADVYFPDFDKTDFDRQELTHFQDKKTGIQYQHVLYKRRK